MNKPEPQQNVSMTREEWLEALPVLLPLEDLAKALPYLYERLTQIDAEREALIRQQKAIAGRLGGTAKAAHKKQLTACEGKWEEG